MQNGGSRNEVNEDEVFVDVTACPLFLFLDYLTRRNC
jgi:hypothetical protein